MFLRKILSATLLVLISAPVWAGVEPFYKGNWDMMPQDIRELEDRQPELNTFNSQNSGYLEYTNDFMGLDGFTDYYFRDGKLYGIRLLNSFKETRMTRQEVESYYERLRKAFEQKLMPSNTKVFQTEEDGNTKYCFYMVGNDTILEGNITYDSADSCVWLNINAADLASPLSMEHIQDYDKIKP